MELSAILTLLAIIALGGSNVFFQWRMGGNNATAAVVTAQKEQILLQDKKINDLTHVVGTLQGQLDEKDKRITLLQELATGNTPELQKFMKDVMVYTTNGKEYMVTSAKTLEKVELCLAGIQKELEILSRISPKRKTDIEVA